MDLTHKKACGKLTKAILTGWHLKPMQCNLILDVFQPYK